jgi:DNA-binding transcriptional MerR regulator
LVQKAAQTHAHLSPRRESDATNRWGEQKFEQFPCPGEFEVRLAETRREDGAAVAFYKPLDSGTDSRVHTEVVGANSLRSGDVARLAGVSADTIRHYEKLGILPKCQRTEGGYRTYSSDAVERVRLTQRALVLGFSLDELAGILQTHDNGGVPCGRVLALTEEKLRSLGKQIQELRQTQKYMRQLVRQWRSKLDATKPGNKARLLHMLAEKRIPTSKFSGNHLKRRSKG